MKNKKNKISIMLTCITVIIFYFSKDHIDRKNIPSSYFTEYSVSHTSSENYPIMSLDDRKIFYQARGIVNDEDKIPAKFDRDSYPMLIGDKYSVAYNNMYIVNYDMENKLDKTYTQEYTIDIYNSEGNEILNNIDLKEIINESELEGWRFWGYETVAIIDNKSYFITWMYKSAKENGGWRDILIIKIDVESGEIEKSINDEVYGDYDSYRLLMEQKYLDFLIMNKSNFYICYMPYNNSVYYVSIPVEVLEREFTELYKILPEVRKYRNVADIQRIDFYMDKDTEMIQIIDLFIEDEMKEQFYENYLEAGGTEEEYETSEYKMIVDEYLAYKEDRE
jgi:hypothetical protein